MTNVMKLKKNETVLDIELTNLNDAEALASQGGVLESMSFWAMGKAFSFIQKSILNKVECFEEWTSFTKYCEAQDTPNLRERAVKLVRAFGVVETLISKGVETAELPANEYHCYLISKHPEKKWKAINAKFNEMNKDTKVLKALPASVEQEEKLAATVQAESITDEIQSNANWLNQELKNIDVLSLGGETMDVLAELATTILSLQPVDVEIVEA